MGLRYSLLLAAVVATSARAQSGSIAGTIKDQFTGEPLRKVVVNLMWHGPPQSTAVAITDGSGRYVFDLLPKGRYELYATRLGWVYAPYGAERPGELGRAIELSAGEHRRDVDFRMWRGSSIEGTVFDEDGDPVVRAHIELLVIKIENGRRTLEQQGGGMSDDRGRYRVFSVQPGKYLLAVRAMGTGMRHMAATRSFYPGVTDSGKAQVLEVRGGATLTGIDLRATSMPAGSLSGRVTGVPEGEPQQRVFAQVSILDDSGGIMAGVPASPPDFNWRLPNLAVGRARVMAHLDHGGQRWRTLRTVDVIEGEQSGIDLALEPAVDLAGSVVYEGAAMPKGVAVSLSPGDGIRFGEFPRAEAGPDGKFVIKQVPAGTWDIKGAFKIIGVSPGSYRLFALRRFNPQAPVSPAMLKPIEDEGTPVEVVEGGRHRADLKVASREVEP